MRRHVALVGLFASFIHSTAQAADEMCRRVRQFSEAPFNGTEQPNGRRWLELHWLGNWMDFEQGWGFGCRQSPDRDSTEFCDWLSKNTSFEFHNIAPQRILSCFGYRFPRGTNWGSWKSEVNLWTKEGRLLILEVNFADLSGQAGAIRLSAFNKGLDDALVELPPMKPWATAEAVSKQ